MTIFKDTEKNEYFIPKYVVSFGCNENGNVFIQDAGGHYHFIEGEVEDVSRVIKRALERDEC